MVMLGFDAGGRWGPSPLPTTHDTYMSVKIPSHSPSIQAPEFSEMQPAEAEDCITILFDLFIHVLLVVVRPGSGHWPLAALAASDFRMHDERSNDVCGERTIHGWNPENDGFSLTYKTYTGEGNSSTA